jgi:glycosyltransferase involved in cell wall biosynthesis
VRVTVALTVYNAAWCVTRALDSVMGQSRPADEVLVTDDGSTDETVALIESRYGSRVRVLRLEHGGLTRSRRAAVEAARSEWVALLDADDWWEPGKLERQVAFLDRHPEVRWCGTDGEYVSEQGVIRASWLSDYFEPVRTLTGDLLPALVERCFPLVSSMMIERGTYAAVGGYDLGVPYSQDYDLWLRLAARHPGAMLAEPLIHYWSSPRQLSRRYEERDRDDLELMRRVARPSARRRWPSTWRSPRCATAGSPRRARCW